MVNCCAYQCQSRSERNETGISFHSFPKNLERCKVWVDNMKIENWKKIEDWYPTKNDRICSKHFEKHWFYKSNMERRVRLLGEAVPTIFPQLPQYSQPKKAKKRPYASTQEQEPSTSAISLVSNPDYARKKKLKKKVFKQTHTEVKFSLKEHPVTAETITVKIELDDFDNRKTANEVDGDLDQESIIKKYSHIKTEEENEETHTEVKFSLNEYPFTGESITIKKEQDDFDYRETANEVDRYLDQNSTIKSEEESFINSQHLISHEEVNIKTEDDVEQSDNWFEYDKVGHKVEDQMNMLKCPDCPYQSKRKDRLKDHALVHNKTGQFETFKCAHCVYETPWKRYLKQHLLVHCGGHILRLHCLEPGCSYNTYHKATLKRHSLVHSDDRFFKCTQCPYRGKHRGDLRQHQVKHESTDKSHACPQCPFKTIRKRCLEKHALTHNKDHAKWLQCTYCSYKTVQTTQLRRHQIRHQDDDGPGWHKCPECPYKTPYKSNLLGHAKQHKAADQTDWFQCPECSYRAPRRRLLKTHQILHTAVDEWFHCFNCPYKTNWKRSLVFHVKMHLQTKIVHSER